MALLKQKLLRQEHFSIQSLVFVAIVFAAVGGYIIYRGNAATSAVGDLNNDGIVDVTDLSILLSNYGKAAPVADINVDGVVNVIDLSILLSNYGKVVSPPTPPTPPPSGSVSYTGPTSISGISNLSATTSITNVVAMTWKLDGKAIGTSSIAPYTYDLNAALSASGTHTMSVEAVDQDGNRSQSAGVLVTIGSAPTGSNIVHLSGTNSGMTLSANQRVYGNGSSTIINGDVHMASGSRLENLVVNGTIYAPNTTNARVQFVTLNSSGGEGVALGNAPGFHIEDSTLNGPSATGSVKGIENTNAETGGANPVIARNTVRNFGGDGIWMVTGNDDDTVALAHLLILDNNVSGVNGPYNNGTQARGIIAGGDLGNVIGNTTTGGTTDGLQPFRSASRMHWARNTVSGTPTGIYIEHFGDHSVYEYNTISASSHGFNVEWIASSSPPRSTIDAHILHNDITAPTAVFADAGSKQIETAFNALHGTLPAIVYQGSTIGSIHDNTACTTASGSITSVYANAGYDPTGNVTQSNNVKSSSC
jgi:hypothetical protein